MIQHAFEPQVRQPLSPVKVFYCYAREDKLLRGELEKHLSNMKRQHLITDWHDREISAGRVWKNEIDANLNAADIILLLVSSDFMHSDYCYSVELKRALERHTNGTARVIPIILRHVDCEDAPFSKLNFCLLTVNPSWIGKAEIKHFSTLRKR